MKKQTKAAAEPKVPVGLGRVSMPRLDPVQGQHADLKDGYVCIHNMNNQKNRLSQGVQRHGLL